jgi:hypothetical protein
MSCERFRAQIVDHAFGADLADAAATHLRGCGACRRLFEGQQRQVAGIDELLQRALEIEPSAEFVARTVSRLERPAFDWRAVLWWAAPAAAAAVLLVAVLATPRSAEDRLAGRHAAAPPSPAIAPPVSDRGAAQATAPGPPSGESAHKRVGGRRTAAAGVEPPARSDVEVLVPSEQAKALARYLTLVRRGVLDTSAIADPARAVRGELVIEPLSVDVLPAASEKPGESAVDRRGWE